MSRHYLTDVGTAKPRGAWAGQRRRKESSVTRGVDQLQTAEEFEIASRQLVEQLSHGTVVARNVNVLHDRQLTVGDRVADQVAATMGSWRFIIIQSCLLAVWLALNIVSWVAHWDAYPFILLNLALSFQAAYAVPIIMMSQKRLAAKDRLAAEHDYAVNVNSELAIAELHEKLDGLRQRQWTELIELQKQQLGLLQRLTACDGLGRRSRASTPAGTGPTGHSREIGD